MENIQKSHRFSRFEKIVGTESLSLLKEKCVLILGVGGVGGYVVESLVRSGVGKVILVDYDKVDLTNINRQIIALNSTIGKYKVDVFRDRIHDINPDCEVVPICEFIQLDNLSVLFQEKIDYFVDACDTVSVKKGVLLECLKRKIPIISSMGTGNKLDPSQLEIVDIRKTVNDPLARILRKFVKEEKISSKVMVLSSREVPIPTSDRVPGSSSFVPSCAGIMIASYVVRKLLAKKKND